MRSEGIGLRHRVLLGSLSAIMLVAMTLLNVIPAEASGSDDQIDLILGGQGSTSWSLDRLQPGDNGTKVVELTNKGPEEGFVTIWVDDIVEVDGASDGAALSNYLYFTPRSLHLASNIEFPATLRELPQSPTDQDTITIGPIGSDETTTLYWDWEFVDNHDPQNEAQGDSIRFDLNFMLTSKSIEPEEYWIIIDVLGKETRVAVTATGHVLSSVNAADTNASVILSFSAGTRILNPDGVIPTRLVLVRLTDQEAASMPPLEFRVGSVFSLDAYVNDFLTSANFTGHVFLTLDVDPLSLPDGTRNIAVFQDKGGMWVRLTHENPPKSWEVTGHVFGTGLFTVGASRVAESGTAFFVADGLTAVPRNASFWEPLTLFFISGSSADVQVSLANLGDTKGNCTVTVYADKRPIETLNVELGSGESTYVEFHLKDLQIGNHDIAACGLSDKLETTIWVNWPLIIFILVSIILIVWYGRRGRER